MNDWLLNVVFFGGWIWLLAAVCILMITIAPLFIWSHLRTLNQRMSAILQILHAASQENAAFKLDLISADPNCPRCGRLIPLCDKDRGTDRDCISCGARFHIT